MMQFKINLLQEPVTGVWVDCPISFSGVWCLKKYHRETFQDSECQKALKFLTIIRNT